MPVDTVIKNCKIVTSEGTVSAGIAIQGERIIAIARDEDLPEGKKTLDARRNFVIPGLVDCHTHLLWPPTEDWSVNLKRETQAAAAGGVTTAVHCLFEHGAGSIVETCKKVTEVYHNNGYVDVAYNAAIFNVNQIKEMEKALEYGVSSFKFLLPYRGREALGGLPGIDDSILYLGFQEIGRLVKRGYKTFARIHAESIEVFFGIEDQCKEKGIDPATYTEVRPNFIEEEGLKRCIAYAKAVECPLFVVHMSIKEGPRVVQEARLEGVDIVVETCPQYLVLNTENTERILSKVNPPIRLKEDNETLWRAIQDGTIEYMGTDHSPIRKEEKGKEFWRAVVGMAGLETWLPVMLSEGVNKGRISLEKLVEICSYKPAKKYGLLPKKGMVNVGSDADLVIVDLNKKARVNAKNLYTRADYSCLEEWELQGWPVLTMVRGNVIMQEGQIIGRSGTGRYIPAKI